MCIRDRSCIAKPNVNPSRDFQDPCQLVSSCDGGTAHRRQRFFDPSMAGPALARTTNKLPTAPRMATGFRISLANHDLGMSVINPSRNSRAPALSNKMRYKHRRRRSTAENASHACGGWPVASGWPAVAPTPTEPASPSNSYRLGWRKRCHTGRCGQYLEPAQRAHMRK